MAKKLILIICIIVISSSFVSAGARPVENIGMDIYNFLLEGLQRDVEKMKNERRNNEEMKRLTEIHRKIKEQEILLEEAANLTAEYLEECIKKEIPCKISIKGHVSM